MFNKPLLMVFATKVEVSKNEFSFVAYVSGSGINFFTDVDPTIHSSEFYTVFVNKKKTEQAFTSLSFAKGDEVKIVCSSENGFPRFEASRKNYFSSVSVLPYMSTRNGTQINTLPNTFNGCTGLTSIPEGLFDNNPEVTYFGSTFSSCTGLTSIPVGLFDNNPKVTHFGNTFSSCTGLTSIPEGLFDNNPEVTYFGSTFYGCKQLSGRVKIGSTKVSACGGFCTNCGAITVVVPAGSTTETTFRAYAEMVRNLTVETFEP